MLLAVRVVSGDAVVLEHNPMVRFAVFVFYQVGRGAWAMIGSPRWVCWAVLGSAVAMLLGALCARFRDIPPIVGALMQIVFYVTPVIWQPEQLAGKARFLLYNPFYALLEIVRAPLLGHVPSAGVWGVAVGTSAVFCALAVWVFVRVRARLVFWI